MTGSDVRRARGDGRCATELLLVDSGIADAAILLAGLRPDVDVLHLSPGGDGIAQIAAHLGGRKGVSALHLLGHGEPGALWLAGERIDADRLAHAGAELASIRTCLAAGAEVALHACAVAAGDAGRRFVAYLGAALGGRIRASASPLGGEAGWSGLQGSPGPFAEHALAAYPHRLGWTSTTGANFSTSTGANLNPVQTDWTGDDTLNITVASHVTAASVANGGGGTDTLELSEDMDLSVSGFTLTGFENLLVYAGQTITFTAGQLGQFTGTITAAGSQTINVSGNGAFTTLANIESFVVGDDSTNARTITINQAGASVTANSATDAVNFSISSGTTYTGTITGDATVGDTLTLANNTNIAGATISNVGTVVIANGGSVTMSETQFEGFTTVTATGNNEVILSLANGDGIVTGNANVELYQLNAAFTFTMAGNHLSVTGNAGANQTIATGTTDTLTGSIAGGTGGSDTLSLDDGDNLAGATVSGFENLTLESGASVTLTASQLSQFSGTVTAAGSETISVSGNGAFTTLANVETFSVGDDSTNARTIPINQAGASVTASSATDAVNFSISSGITYTGTIAGEATVGDTLTLANNANIAGATIGNVATVSIASGASVTMTETQFEGFTTFTAPGNNQVIISSANGDGSLAGNANVELYTLNGAFTFTMAANHTNVTGSDGADQSVATGTTDTLTGTLNGGAGGSDTLLLDTGDDISGATVSNFENLTLSGGASVTMTAAQLNAFTGTITAAGTDAVALTTTGTVTADLTGIETLATAANASGQTLTLSAAAASGKTLTAGDAGHDSFVVTASAGAQAVTGSAGNDTIDGGAGADTIAGGDGQDTLTGGADADQFTGSVNDFNLDTITDFAIGDSIVVTGVDLSALNGTAASGTIALPGADPLTLTGITAASGTFAASFSGGNTTITLVAPSGGGGGDGGGGGGSSGDLVVTDNRNNDSTGGARTITNNGGSPGSAAIVQNTGNNGNLVTATLPPSVQISSEGPATGQTGTTASQTLINAIDVRDTAGETGSIGGAQGFLNALSPTTPLDVRTIVPTQSSGISTDDPIVITGSSNGSQVEAFVIDMRSITGKTLQVNNIEFVSVMGNATVTGGAGNNYAVGDDNAQFISLGAGNDTLYGGGGADTVGSADGNDVLFGDAGTDRVLGGTGSDTLWGGTEADVVYGNQDADLLYGNQANDTLYGGQNGDTLFGGQNDDLAYGNLGDDVLYGNLGTDTLYGGSGNDALYGGQSDGQELLVGGSGDDTLAGGKGADLMSGGDGADLILVEAGGGADTVADFAGAAGDRVRIAANANGTAIDSFAELKAAAIDSADGVTIALGGGNTLLLMGVRSSELQADWFSFA